jgi:DNA-binding transcriptional regulator GbsR (MarR family)
MLEKDPVTQDELINMTGSSRSNVSKVLTMMEELNVLEVIKKPKIRKKYYNSNTSIEEYGLGKRKRVQGYYAQIQMMMQKKFLPDLKQIEPISKEDKAEKERLQNFFNENFNFFSIFIRYSNAMHTTVQKVLKEFVESYLS